MASSVARMPPADDWRSPSRLHHHHPLSITLRKVLVRDPSEDPRRTADPPPSPATAARRRQSQILDRWAARQARGMITTIERQAHDAELSALSSSSQPLSARAACFNPSFSPSTTPPPTIAAPAPPEPPDPIPPLAPSNSKASSLIQMWRELEAESGVPLTPRATVSNAVTSPRSVSSDSVVAREQQEKHVGVGDFRDGSVVASPRVNALRVRGRKEIEEVMTRLEQERRRELERLMERQAVSRFLHRGRLQSLLRFMLLRRESVARQQPRSASKSSELDQLQTGSTILSLRQRFNFRGHHDGTGEPIAERLSSFSVQLANSQDSSNKCDHQFKMHTSDYKTDIDGSKEQAMKSSTSSHTQFCENSHDSGYTCTSDQLPQHNQDSSNKCDHQFKMHTSDYKTDTDGSKEQAMKSSTSSHAQFCENSHDSGYTCTSDQLPQHNFNRRNQYDGNTETVAECPSSFIIQLLDNSKDSQLNGQISDHRNQYDVSEHSVPESVSSPNDQFPDGSRDAVYTSTVDQFLQQFNHAGQHGGSGEAAAESSSNLQLQYPDITQNSGYGCTADQFLQQFNHAGQHGGSGEAAAESSSNLQLQYPDVSQNSGYVCTADQFTSENNPYQDVTVNMYPEVNSPQSRSEDLQEGISTDGSWDERNLWVSTLDLGRPMYSSVAPSWHSETVSEEMEPCSQQDVKQSDGAWISDFSKSWGAPDNSQRGIYHDSVENYSDNVEIRELLGRRRVSTSLASGFRETMNRLVISFLQKQEQHYGDEDPYDEQYLCRHNGTTVSSSLVPLPYQTIQQPDSWHDATFGQSSSQRLMEVETRQDLRSDITQIHHEIIELRKLVESCMGWQTKLEHSIKQEISSAIREAVKVGENPNWTPMRKGTCCICCEVPIDSLLYRCGHMCTCFKCAHELQWSSGRCPICRAAIVDVVRAYTNS